MAFRLRPVDASFYDLFAESAAHLVAGAGYLAEMLSDGSDREGQKIASVAVAVDQIFGGCSANFFPLFWPRAAVAMQTWVGLGPSSE